MFKCCRFAYKLDHQPLQYGLIWNLNSSFHVTSSRLKKCKYNPYIAKHNNIEIRTSDAHVKKTSTIPIALRHLQFQNNDESKKLDKSKAMDEHQDHTLEKLEKSLQAIEDELYQHQKELEQLTREHSDADDTIEITSPNEKPVKVNRRFMFGTANPEIPISDVPCGGCGALLHCQNSAIPGYLPQEKFADCDKKELETMVCQRCHYMSTINQIVDIEADKGVYQEVIKKIQRERKSFILMLVDVTDMKHTFIKDILNGMRKQTSLYLICNKIDLIPKDGDKLFSRIKKALIMECERAGIESNMIRHTAFISAKTGYGVEDLISQIIKDWDHEAHIYMVGTTNSGKSTLFNTFLDSDLCKADVRDIVQRATISNWPGTTLNLVKFPLINPLGWKKRRRFLRLVVDQPADHEAFMEQKERLSTHGRSINAVLRGTVGKTNYTNDQEKQQQYLQKYMPTGDDWASFSLNAEGNSIDSKIEKQEKDFLEKRRTVSDEMYPTSKWLYDTPGLINDSQIINRLTAPELRQVLPKTILRPRVFVMRPGQVMFISGLARLDYLQGAMNTKVTVHTSMYIPVHVIADHAADNFYTTNVGTDVLGVPLGDEDRLGKLPSLCARDFTFTSDCIGRACADIQISSLGWVSFMLKEGKTAHIKAYMPGGDGMYLRQPALLPNISTFRGRRKRKSTAYHLKKLIL